MMFLFILAYPFLEFFICSWFIDKYSWSELFYSFFMSGTLGLFIILYISRGLSQLVKKPNGLKILPHHLSIMLGAILLFLPGLVSDVLGLLLILPGLRHYLIFKFKSKIFAKMNSNNFTFGFTNFNTQGFGGFKSPHSDPVTFNQEQQEIDVTPKKIQ
jgi:UPF0716 family protein affecting phage T7 exclusion